jgi:hypothetical protein
MDKLTIPDIEPNMVDTVVVPDPVVHFEEDEVPRSQVRQAD